MDCFHQTLIQVRIWVLSDERQPRWLAKWLPPVSVRCRGHSNLRHFLSDFFQILYIFIASIKLLFKFDYKFSPTNANQYGRQNGHHLSICFYGQSTLIIYYPITSKFHIWITFIKLSPADKRDDRHLSVYTCGHSILVIYHPYSFFHIWTTFIKLLFMSEYGFYLMNDYQDFCQNGYPLFAAGH